jgi:site-specific recombinase XerD
MFRHSRALSLYRNGVPLPLISEWLGHSNLETTLIYAYADTEMKREAINNAMKSNHPLYTTHVGPEDSEDHKLRYYYGLS